MVSRLPPGVRRRGDRFQARWRDATGHQRSATFETPDAAYSHAVNGSDPAASGGAGVTVGQWAPRWQAAAQGRPSSVARDDSYLRTHVLPGFGNRDLAEITTWDIQEWISGLGERLAPGSIHKVVGVLSKLMGAAMAAGLIEANPCKGVVLPRIESTEARFLTPTEVHRLDQVIGETAPHWAELVPLLVDTGLRIGEAAALTVGDVDLDGGSIRVHRNLVEVRGHIHLGAPKSRHGVRTVPMLTESTADRLRARIDRLRLTDSDPMLGATAGGYMRPSLLRSRVFRPAMRRSGIEGRVTPHTLRHTAIALWIAAGVADPYKLSRWAGHRDPGTIYRIYGHLLPEDTTGYRRQLEALRLGGIEQDP